MLPASASVFFQFNITPLIAQYLTLFIESPLLDDFPVPLKSFYVEVFFPTANQSHQKAMKFLDAGIFSVKSSFRHHPEPPKPDELADGIGKLGGALLYAALNGLDENVLENMGLSFAAELAALEIERDAQGTIQAYISDSGKRFALK